MKLNNIQLILHIGLHKTGTTYLQNSLKANREVLIEGGVLFPETGFCQNQRESGEIVSPGHQAWVEHMEWNNRPELLHNLSTEIESAPQKISTVIISCENLTYPGYSKNFASESAAIFREFGDIKVAAYLRQPDRWLESYYKENVTGSWNVEKRSFADFCFDECGNLVDFYGLLSPWIKQFHSKNIHLRQIEQFRNREDLLLDFLEQAKFDANLIPKLTATNELGSYKSPGRDVTELLRIYSKFIAFDDNFSANILALRSRLSEASNHTIDTLLTAELQKLIFDKCAEPMAKLSELFFAGAELYTEPAEAAIQLPEPDINPNQIELLCEAIKSSSGAANSKEHEPWLFALPRVHTSDD